MKTYMGNVDIWTDMRRAGQVGGAGQRKERDPQNKEGGRDTKYGRERGRRRRRVTEKLGGMGNVGRGFGGILGGGKEGNNIPSWPQLIYCIGITSISMSLKTHIAEREEGME